MYYVVTKRNYIFLYIKRNYNFFYIKEFTYFSFIVSRTDIYTVFSYCDFVEKAFIEDFPDNSRKGKLAMLGILI